MRGHEKGRRVRDALLMLGHFLDNETMQRLMALAQTADLSFWGDSLLRGPIADQAALYGVLDRLRDLGVALISLRCDEVERCVRQGTLPNPSWCRVPSAGHAERD